MAANFQQSCSLDEAHVDDLTMLLVPLEAVWQVALTAELAQLGQLIFCSVLFHAWAMGVADLSKRLQSQPSWPFRQFHWRI